MVKRRMYKQGEAPRKTRKYGTPRITSTIGACAQPTKNRQRRPMASYDGKSITETTGIKSSRTPEKMSELYTDTRTPVDERISDGRTKFFKDEIEAEKHASQTRSYKYPINEGGLYVVGWGVPK